MNHYTFNQKTYRANLNKKTKAFFPITIVLIIILLGIALLFKTDNTNQYEFYFVQIDSFSNYSSAENLRNQLQKQNTLSYIHFDEEYRVLISFYPTKKQAENVANRLAENYKNTSIYTLFFDEFNGKNYLAKKQNDSIFDIIDSIESIIDNLNSQLIQYEKNEISTQMFTTKISKEIDSFEDEKDSLFNHLDQPKFHKHREIVDDISKSMTNIKSHFKEQNLAQIVRFEIMQTAFNLSKFCALF